MTSVGRSAIARLLLLVLPFHALAAIYLDLRGPGHFHVHDDADADDHGHVHAHDHAAIEHHRHAATDRSVVTVEDQDFDSREPAEEISLGWSATMCAALVSAAAPVHVPRAASGVVTKPVPRLKTRFPERLERPPRFARV